MRYFPLCTDKRMKRVAETATLNFILSRNNLLRRIFLLSAREPAGSPKDTLNIPPSHPRFVL